MRKIIFVGLIMGALAGCSDSSVTPTPGTLPTAQAIVTATRSDIGQQIDLNQISTPESGKAVVFGNVGNPTNNKPYSQIQVQLAEVYDGTNGELPYVLDTTKSPNTFADDDGDFVFENIPPHRYVIVVGDIYGYYKVLLDENNVTKVIDVKADEKFDLGQLKVDIFAQ